MSLTQKVARNMQYLLNILFALLNLLTINIFVVFLKTGNYNKNIVLYTFANDIENSKILCQQFLNAFITLKNSKII